MRSTDQQIQTTRLTVSYVSPYNWWVSGVNGWITGTNPWQIRLTEPGAKLVSVNPEGTSGGAPDAVVNSFNPEATPGQAQVQFLTPAGAAGGYGGDVYVQWKKLA